MDIAESDLLFIDVDASTPTVKQEQEDVTETDHSTAKKHGAENRFKCNTCDYTTYHRALFQEHVNRHKGIKPYKCEYCPYSSVSKKYVRKHQEKHKKCVCGYLSRNSLELKRHVAKCGATVATCVEDVEASLLQLRRCLSCNREYVDKKALEKHVANSQSCSLCSLDFCTNSSLKAHMLREHSVKTEQVVKKYRFKCAVCEWSCGLQQKILLHLIHHPQPVDQHIDVTVLRRYHILPE